MARVQTIYDGPGTGYTAPSVTNYAAIPGVETLIGVTEGTMWFKLDDDRTITAGHGKLLSFLPGELVEFGALDAPARFTDFHVWPEAEEA